MSIIKSNHILNIQTGSGEELGVSIYGSGKATYTIQVGEKAPQKQTLNGAGSVQTYENLSYPIIIDNQGPASIVVSE